ncbi:MAG: DUF2723 domain-containing protein [bacterium]
MGHKRTNRIVAAAVFAITLLTYLFTLPPTVVFWDVPEHCAASYLLQVQHPPGSPLLVIIMRVASMIPIFSDIAVRMNFINALASSIVVTLLYLITVRIILLRQFVFSTDGLKFVVVASLIFFSVYPGIVKWFPSMLDGEVWGKKSDLWIVLAIALPLAAISVLFYSVKKKNRILNIAALSVLFILLGYSIYAVVFIRANVNPPMNENDPSTLQRLVLYLEREQYGETPLLERRWSNEPEKAQYFKNYTSDFDYLWSYQINHMYLRYFGWNFIGKEDDWQGAGVRFGQLYGIPFLLGLIGFFYHWKIDQKMAFIMTIYFILTGLALAVYFNMQQEQPRERDYFFVYSFFGFCLWIGLGTLAIVNYLEQKLKERTARIAGYAAMAAAFVFVPVNMFRTTVHPSSRSGHFVTWDYAYNLLQSTEKDAILITHGDNDTFPLWYLQDVEGVCRDVRVICLSLANTDWYIKQLKHNEPYGAKKVPISMTDEQITGILPVQYEPQMVSLPVTRNAAEGWDSSNTDPRGLEVVDTLKYHQKQGCAILSWHLS